MSGCLDSKGPDCSDQLSHTPTKSFKASPHIGAVESTWKKTITTINLKLCYNYNLIIPLSFLKWVLLFFYFYFYLFFERQRANGGEGQRERENLKQAQCSESDVGLDPTT